MRLPKICSIARRSLTRVGRSSATVSVASLAASCCARLSPCCSSSERRSMVCGVSTRRPSRDSLRMALIRPVHLRRRGPDEAERFRQVGLDRRASVRRDEVRRLRLRLRQEGSDVGPHRLELAREAHHVDERRAQVVADDVGEALDLVVGRLQVGDALGDQAFQVLVGRRAARPARAAGSTWRALEKALT